MPYTLILHLTNSEPIVGESEALPAVTDTMVQIKNPRRMDGKDIHYLAENVMTVYWPVDKLSFIEVMNDGEEEEIIGFVRE